jgi:hypothetical protein
LKELVFRLKLLIIKFKKIIIINHQLDSKRQAEVQQNNQLKFHKEA